METHGYLWSPLHWHWFGGRVGVSLWIIQMCIPPAWGHSATKEELRRQAWACTSNTASPRPPSPPPGFHTLNAFNHFTCSIYVWTDPWTQDLLMWGEFWIERNVARAEMAIWEIREDLFLKMGPNYKLIIGVLLRNRVRLTRYTWMGFVELFQVSEVAAHFVRCYLEQNKDILVFAEMWKELECLIQRLSPFGKKGYSVPGQNMP